MSAFGPTLFNISKNYILTSSRRTVQLVMAAISVTVKNLHHLQNELIIYISQITKYFQKWGLYVNPTETITPIFNRGSPMEAPIAWSKSLKYLGMILNPGLNPNKHVASAKRKSICKLKQLCPTFSSNDLHEFTGIILHYSPHFLTPTKKILSLVKQISPTHPQTTHNNLSRNPSQSNIHTIYPSPHRKIKPEIPPINKNSSQQNNIQHHQPKTLSHRSTSYQHPISTELKIK